MDKFNLAGLIIFFLVLGIVFGPIVLIYGINTLGAAAVSGFAIPYTLDTWFAALLVMALLRGAGSSSRR